MPHAPSAPRDPRTGPARPTRASARAFFGICFIVTSAPRKGMNIGAEAGIPSRLSCRTWPISCTQIRTTNPTANQIGKSKAYAPTLTTIVKAVPMNLVFSASSARPLNLTSRTPTAARGAKRRLSRLQGPPWSRGYWGPSDAPPGRCGRRALLPGLRRTGRGKEYDPSSDYTRPAAGPAGLDLASPVPVGLAVALLLLDGSDRLRYSLEPTPGYRIPAIVGEPVGALFYLLQRALDGMEPPLHLLP